MPFPVKVKIGIKVKGSGQEYPLQTGKVKININVKSSGGAPALHSLRELEAIGFAEVVPGFAVAVVFVICGGVWG